MEEKIVNMNGNKKAAIKMSKDETAVALIGLVTGAKIAGTIVGVIDVLNVNKKFGVITKIGMYGLAFLGTIDISAYLLKGYKDFKKYYINAKED